MGPVWFLVASVALSSGLVGAGRSLARSSAGSWSEYGDGFLFWLTWAGDPGRRRLLAALALAAGVVILAQWEQRRKPRTAPEAAGIRPASWVVRALGRPWIALAAVGLALLPQAAVSWFRPDPGSRPPILLVVLDTVRADALGWGGSSLPTSPALDRLAEGGAVFRNAIAQSSWTKPSVATVLTGLVPSRHEAVGRPSIDWYPNLEERQRTLAEAFAAAGYDTAGVSSNPNVSPYFGFDQGFRRFHQDTSMRAEEALRHADAFLGQMEGPFFFYLHLNDPHYPYDPPQGSLGRFGGRPAEVPLTGPTEAEFRLRRRSFSAEEVEQMRLRQAEEIRYVDDQIGPWLDALLGRHPDLVVAVLSDHGEEFLEHGDLGHGHTLYDELLHVPLQFAWGAGWSGQLRRGDWDQQVRLMDVPPTLLELADLDLPEAAPVMDGTSLLPWLRGTPAKGRPAFAETESPGSPLSGATGPLRAWREAGAKLILTDPFSAQAGRYWRFDLQRDPQEQSNLAGEDAAALAALRSRIEESGWLLRKQPLPTDPARLPDGPTADLAVLGYADLHDSQDPENGRREPRFEPGSVPWWSPPEDPE